jgi:hypothetical protein
VEQYGVFLAKPVNAVLKAALADISCKRLLQRDLFALVSMTCVGLGRCSVGV